MARYFLSDEVVTHGDLVTLIDEQLDDLKPNYLLADRVEDHHSDIAEMFDLIEKLQARVNALEAEIALCERAS